MATCPNGHKNPDNQNFCGECAARIRTESESKPNAGEAGYRLVAADIELPGKSGVLRRTRTEFIGGHDEAPPPGSPKNSAPLSTSGAASLSSWPPDAEPYYRPSLIAAIAASVGVMVGSVSPWVTALIITVTGLDAGNWGVAALTLGAISSIALLIELFWPRTPFNPRWAVPLAWVAVVGGAACVGTAVPFLIRIMTIPKANILGIPVGAGVGWGLWLLAFSSAVLCVTASIVAVQIAKSIELLQPLGQSTTSWTNGWRWAAIITSAVTAISGVVYVSVNWENNSRGYEPSPTEMPSFPSFPSFPTTAMQSTTTAPPTYMPSPVPATAPLPTVTSTPGLSAYDQNFLSLMSQEGWGCTDDSDAEQCGKAMVSFAHQICSYSGEPIAVIYQNFQLPSFFGPREERRAIANAQQAYPNCTFTGSP